VRPARAALRAGDPASFETMAGTPASFVSMDAGTELRACQPLIDLADLDGLASTVAVNSRPSHGREEGS
jgi:hypothetical protein